MSATFRYRETERRRTVSDMKGEHRVDNIIINVYWWRRHAQQQICQTTPSLELNTHFIVSIKLQIN